ncbi:PAS domain S-box protein [Fulvivirga lutea]|uniref:histidine kinase n=1 Tax=Fulvivirga lutea TaxID=2810512 RepID=A0A975A210_9BACT|nr:PAS domain S-box protein [Fulvivirga lutea]QSE98800.1 PAS domain S-box protein [Fulvivirga lutea]
MSLNEKRKNQPYKNDKDPLKDFKYLDPNKDIYKQIFEFSIIPTIVHDLNMNIIDVNNSALKEFGYSKEEFLSKSVFELHTEGQLNHSEEVRKKMKTEDTISVETKFKRKDGSVFDAEVTPCRYLIGQTPIIHVYIKNITSRKVEEKNLNALNKKLLSTNQELKDSINLNDYLTKEIHHRTKNNLQMLNSIISLQALKQKNYDTQVFIKSVSSKIYSIAKIHELLLQSENHDNLLIKDYILSITNNILQNSSKFKHTVRSDFEKHSLQSDYALNLGFITNELITNVIKHAYPDGKGFIDLKLSKTNDTYTFSVKDYSAQSFNEKANQGIESSGWELINIFTEQLKGKMEVKYDNGNEFILTFPE